MIARDLFPRFVYIALSVSALVAFVAPPAVGLQVYLTELSIHQIRRIPAIEGGVSIYFQCANEGAIYLPKVQDQDIQYIWNSEDLAVVSVSPRSCKACAFYEDRKFPLKKDDVLGSQFQVCEVDFAETGVATKLEEGQFEASFQCQECKALPPAPPTPVAPVPPPSSDDSSKRKGLSGGAIASIIVAASVSSFILGLAVFAVYQMHWARRKAQAEVAFEAALQDSGLGLDDAFEQDAEAFHQSLLHPSAWYKLNDGPSEEEA